MRLVTQDELKLEAQIEMCKMAVYEYFKGQCITIDYRALFQKLDPPSLLFQFSHMIAFHKMGWKDALMWVVTNRGRILAYSDGKIDEWGNLKHAEVSVTAERTDSGDSKQDAGSKG